MAEEIGDCHDRCDGDSHTDDDEVGCVRLLSIISRTPSNEDGVEDSECR